MTLGKTIPVMSCDSLPLRILLCFKIKQIFFSCCNIFLLILFCRLGFHLPPFSSVPHLHLHALAPASKMNLKSQLRYGQQSYWFITVSQGWIEPRKIIQLGLFIFNIARQTCGMVTFVSHLLSRCYKGIQ